MDDGNEPASGSRTPGTDEPYRESRSVVFDVDDSAVDTSAAPAHTPLRGVASSLDRARHILARFGRLSGMHLPGISYTALDSGSYAGSGSGGPRRVGGGINQDGVFSNMNAKPERPRSRRAGDEEDRGEDDDLADDSLPPTYEAAAADTAPSYWESTVFSGHALTETDDGWSPDGPHIGEVPDMIVDGMLLGTVFAFVWNMLVSAVFQFMGFILTFLLHSTHAAKYGSRTGLGVTLAQFSSMLLSRLAAAQKEMANAPLDTGTRPRTPRKRTPSAEEMQHARTLCRILLAAGVLLIVHSVFAYARMLRTSRAIVAAARRTSAHAPNQPEEAPEGLVHQLLHADPRALLRDAAERWRETFVPDLSLLDSSRLRTNEEYGVEPSRGPAALLFAADSSYAQSRSPLGQGGLSQSSPRVRTDHVSPRDVEMALSMHA